VSRRRAILARLPAIVAVSIALYYAVLGGEYSAFDLVDLAGRQEREAEALAATRARVDSLSAVAELLESDPATIEAVARERFGMIRDGEILYRFVDVEPDSGSSSP
jgi:cell division protein FtsB